MFTILLHSSKTMRQATSVQEGTLQTPALETDARKLSTYLARLSLTDLQKYMNISGTKAVQTHQLLQDNISTHYTLPAIDSFLGDIYSGLQVQSLSAKDRAYANQHLYILSGLYGVLRALDSIQPYRLEMGYKLPAYPSLYTFWGTKIAEQLPKNQPIINLSAKEYTKAVFPHLKHIEGLQNILIISPKFLTISPKTNEPTFVTVHAKIARGAYARWLIQHKVNDSDALHTFNELGYQYDNALSTPEEPVFVAQTFKGLGLSVRRT